MDKQTALALAPERATMSPIDLIQQALSTGTSPEVIRELVALQQSMERFNWEREERQSKIDFDDALNACQKRIERVAPNMKRNDTSSWWADYAQLDKTIRPIYTGAGFSVSFSEVEPISKCKVRIKADLSRSGISKEYFREITPTTTGPKGNAMATATDADAIAAARAQRYLLISIFNIAVGIDKQEKAGIPQTQQGEMDIAEFDDWRTKIENASDVGKLINVHAAAHKRAVEIGDKGAVRSFMDAKNSRKEQLR